MAGKTVGTTANKVTAPAYVTSRNLGYGKSRKLHVGSFGKQRSGKTRLLFTAILATDTKLGLIPLDRNSIPTCMDLEREYDLEGMVVYPPRPLFSKSEVRETMKAQMLATRAAKKKEGDRTPAEREALVKVKDTYKAVVERAIEQVLVYSESDEIGIVGIDTGEQLYTFMQLSDFGKLESNIQRNRGALNQDFRNIINLCMDKHLIITHPSKPEYRKKANSDDGEATGRDILDGWPQLGPSMNVVVEHVKIDDAATKQHYANEMEVNPKSIEVPTWLIRPFESQANPWLSRKHYGHCLVNEDCTFEELGAIVYGEADKEEGTVEKNMGWLSEDE